jgi:hypothetical protein
MDENLPSNLTDMANAWIGTSRQYAKGQDVVQAAHDRLASPHGS